MHIDSGQIRCWGALVTSIVDAISSNCETNAMSLCLRRADDGYDATVGSDTVCWNIFSRDEFYGVSPSWHAGAYSLRHATQFIDK